jgi:hypothetical protein
VTTGQLAPIDSPVDMFGGEAGEEKARLSEVYGFAFLAHKSIGD